MAFLFKSKKNQDRALSSRDGPPQGRIRDEKSSGHRSTPTGSLNSIDNDGSAGSPDQGYARQRSQSNEQGPQTSPQQAAAQQPPQGSSDLPFRNSPTAGQPPPSNPNSSLYPWSQRRLTYTSSHPSPFPRYGAAVNSVASKEGDIYVMGGLINSTTVKGDLWMIEAGGSMVCYPLATTAEGPGPRVGHASLLVGNAFIVYGGDTKIDETDVLDETLYLLNTSTRQWSRALPAGPRPSGRYGHSLNILGSKIYIFGGQVEGYFMNDLAAFDLNQLQMPNNRWEMLIENSDSAPASQGKIPPARTNHSVITYNDKMYLFGGTNGFQWFNDVWSYDPATNLWMQLDCIGYIPVPREGHAAAVVDDVMYIFGGRTEEGADLGDLAAFRITSRRWYTFQNMGPSPSPRSGHSTTAVGKTIVVVGGEPSSAATAVNDLGLVYCLDTTKIRYPNDSQQKTPAGRRPSVSETRNLPSRDGSQGPPDSKRLQGPPLNAAAAAAVNVGRGTSTPDLSGPNGTPAPIGTPNGPIKPRPPVSMGPAGPPPQGQPPKPNTGAPRGRNPSLERTEKHPSPQSQSPVVTQGPTLKEGDGPLTNGVRAVPAQQPARSASRQAELAPASRQPEPVIVVRQPEPPIAEAPKPRATRQARSQGSVDSTTEPALKVSSPRPSSPPPPTKQTANLVSKRSSVRNSQTVALLKELDISRNKNAWYASELELARRAGYSSTASLSPMLEARSAETFDDEDKPLIEALLAMRTELANVQASVDKQAVLAAKQIAEAERQRDAAIQEAVYAKARLASHSGGLVSTPPPDSGKDLDGRGEEVGRKLAYALNSQRDLQTQLERLAAELDAERKNRRLADETSSAAERRMKDLEAYKQQNSSELERLKAELHLAQRESREQSIAAAEAVSAAQMLRVEKDELHGKYQRDVGESQETGAALVSLRSAVATSSETKALLERKLDEERAQREMVEAKLVKLKAEHEARTAELVTVTQRLRDAEELAEQHASEARSHQQAVLTGLGKVGTRDVGQPNEGDAARLLALQDQLSTANGLVRKYQQEADTASDRLRSAEERIAGLEAYQEQASRDGVSIRRQLQSAMRDTQTLQAANSELRHQLASQQLETNAMSVQHNTLKDILSERGISPTSAGRARSQASPREGSPEATRLRDLENQVASAVAAHEETKMSAALAAQESETAYREKLAQLENDYQSAVHYVKGTEKMLKQLKEQLSRYKTDNARLKEEMIELQDHVETSSAARNAAAGWETERTALQSHIDSLQAELQASGAQLEKQVQSIRQELADARKERDSALRTKEETNQHLQGSQQDLEALRHENSLLERRALDAEAKVSSLLDQVELSVDSYRRRSRQAPSLGSDLALTPSAGSAANGNGNGVGHARQESSDAGSMYGGLGDARNSTALDNLANELETLRTHWEATNKNYRLSNTFDFEGAGVSPISKRDDTAGMGLSESLADWRKRLDDSHPEGGPGGHH